MLLHLRLRQKKYLLVLIEYIAQNNIKNRLLSGILSFLISMNYIEVYYE